MATLIKKTVEGQAILKDVSNPTPDSVIAPTENNPTSLHTYATGAYVKVRGVLRKVLSPISVGQAFTDTNSEETTVGEELTQIHADLSELTSEFLLATVSSVGSTVSVQLSDSLSNYRNIRLIAQNTYTGSHEFTVAEVSVAFFKAHCTNSNSSLSTGNMNTGGGGAIYYSNDTTIYAQRVATYNANIWIYGVGKIS